MTKLGRYTVEDELGRGSMGVVYLAHDPQIRRRVAVKTISLPDGLTADQKSEFRARFLREAQAAGSLTHPGIVTIYGVEALDDHDMPFITMEYVAGRNLQHIIETEGRLVPERAFQMAMSLAEALQTAHAAGIIHRDIKPANILVRDKDGAVKITDFGVARLPTGDLTQGNGVLGSPSYMAPEQISSGKSDQRSDLFSLAVILYESLSGERLFRGEDLVTIAHKVTNDKAPRLAARIRSLPPAVDAFFDRALAKDPEKRYPDAAAFREAINELLLEIELDQLSTTTSEVPFVVVGDAPAPAAASTAPHIDFTNPRIVGAIAGGVVVFLLAVLGVVSILGPDKPAPAEVAGADATAARGSATDSTPPKPTDWVDPGPGLTAPATPAAALNTTDTAGAANVNPSEAVETVMSAVPATPPAQAQETAPVEPAPPKKTPPAPAPAKVAEKTPVPAPTEPVAEVADSATDADAAAVDTPDSGFDAETSIPIEDAAPKAVAVEMGSLLIAVNSKVKSGTLRVLVDGEEIYTKELMATGKKFNRLLKKVTQKAHEATEEAIEIPAGAHTITARLQIEGKAAVSEASVDIVLTAGTTQPIEILAGRKFGMGDALRLRLGK